MPSAQFWIDFFRRNFGPTLKTFEVVGEAGAPALEADLRALLARWNTSGDETLVVAQAYVDAISTP